jgi:L-ascorbate metabolism protein UlaG (beta-lactamase superfamily)
VDFVVISHNHFDHLNVKTVRELEERFGGDDGDLRWLVPMGLKSVMESFGCRRVEELTWGETTTVVVRGKNFSVHCLPAQHWSANGFFDRWKVLQKLYMPYFRKLQYCTAIV